MGKPELLDAYPVAIFPTVGTTRKQFLSRFTVAVAMAAAFPLMTACSREPEEVIEIPDGEWSKEAVLVIASSMLKEDELNDIAYAGWVLLGNQQGEKTFSRQNPVVADDEVKLITKPTQQCPLPDGVCYAGLHSKGEGDRVEGVLRSKTQEGDQEFSSYEKESITEISLGKSEIAGMSSLGVKFLIAKEIYNLRAYQILSEFALDMFSQKYDLPQTQKELDAVKVWTRYQLIKFRGYSLPIDFSGDFLAQFLLVPNYLIAKESGRLNSFDHKAFELLDQSADYFLKNLRILYKKDGKYHWIQDEKTLIGWLDALVWVHKAFYNSTPSQPSKQIKLAVT